MKYDPETFRTAIARARKATKHHVTPLAAQLEVSARTLWTWENTATYPPRYIRTGIITLCKEILRAAKRK